MRRMSAWAVVTAVLLALGIGVLVGRALDDDTDAASSTASTSTSSSSSSSSSSSTSLVDEATTESTTTTVKIVTAAPQTASTTTPTTRAPSVTTAPGSPATTARQPSNPACGSGTATASAKLAISGSGPPANPQFTYSGPVTVTNNTTKAIEVDSLVLRITSKDGTNEDVPVAGTAGTTITAGATHDFGFSHTTTREPRDDGGVSVLAFSYGPPNSTVNCGST